MIELIAYNTALDLTSDASITLNLEANLFEYGKVKGTQTFPFELPDTELNRKFFESPHHHQRRGSAFHDIYENVQLKKDSKLLAIGTLELEESERGGYKGVFKADAAALSEFGAEKIRTIIEHEEWFFPDTNLDALENYTAVDSVIVFPTIQLGEMTFNNYAMNGKYQRDLSGTGGLIPFFKLFFVLKLLANNLGYVIENEISEADLEKLIIFNHRELFAQEVPIFAEESIQYPMGFRGDDYDHRPFQVEVGTETYLPEKIRIADHIPNVTLSEFIAGLRAIFGLSMTFDSKRKILRLKLLRDILNENTYIERTPQAESRYRKKKLKYDGFQFSFSLDSDDERQANAPKELDESRFKGELLSVELGDRNPDEIADNFENTKLFLAENAYFRVSQVTEDGTATTTAYPYRWYADAIFPIKIDDGKTAIKTIFSPVAKSKYYYQSIDTQILTVSKKDKRLRIETDTVFPQMYRYAELIFVDSNWYPNQVPVGIFEFDAKYIDLSLNSFVWANGKINEYDFTHTHDEEVEVILKFTDYRYVPQAKLEAYRPKQVSETGDEAQNVDFAPRLLFYHGKQPWNHAQNPPHYPCATSDNYNSIRERIGNLAIRWNGTDGLYEILHKPFVEFWKQAEEVHYKMRLTLEDILSFNPEVKWRIRDMNYFVKKISITLTHNYLAVANVILIRAGEGLCRNTLTQLIYHVCAHTLDILEQHYCQNTLDILEQHYCQNTLDVLEQFACQNTLDVLEQHYCQNTLDVVEQFACTNTLMVEEYYVENDGT